MTICFSSFLNLSMLKSFALASAKEIGFSSFLNLSMLKYEYAGFVHLDTVLVPF